MKYMIFFLLLVSGIFVSCSSGNNLTKQEKSKLDPSLQRLLKDEVIADKNYNVRVAENGSKMYGVIIRCSDATQLEQAGIPVNSVSGDIITAKLSIEQIRKVVTLPAVSSVENSTKSYPK
jgi:hypothetical protein